ncbi:50S ribosomal protein L9 [bacterium]|nr:50S ribosomal protein L9 [bacterium]
MQVILTDDVVGLGDIGETVKVRPGYARNFLIPRGFAVEMGAKSAGAVAHKMRQIDAKKKRMKAGAEELANKVRDLAVKIGLRMGANGRVFGSITTKDIAEELKKQGIVVDRRRVLLSEPIKKIGIHFVQVKLHPEVVSQIKVDAFEVQVSQEDEAQLAEQTKRLMELKAKQKEAEAAAEQQDS